MLLEHLIHDDDFPECNRLCRCDGVSELSCVADVRGECLKQFNIYFKRWVCSCCGIMLSPILRC